jgi:predicted transcriptional regulator
MSEYSSKELKDVSREVLRVFGRRQAGCTPREVAGATGHSEEVVRACLEYLVQDGKVVREGGVYAPDPKYVYAVGVEHAKRKVEDYLKQVKRATVEKIVSEVTDEQGRPIKRGWVEMALLYLAGQKRARYDEMTGEWVYLPRGA